MAMTIEDIERMAREAGMYYFDGVADPWTATPKELARFAELVAAVEREACATMVNSIDESLADAIRARGEK